MKPILKVLNLHGEMIYKTQPAPGMFEENVESLLKGFTTPMVENVFCFESLVDRQRNWVIRVVNWKGKCAYLKSEMLLMVSGEQTSFCSSILNGNLIGFIRVWLVDAVEYISSRFRSTPIVFASHWSRHTLVVCFKFGCSKSP